MDKAYRYIFFDLDGTLINHFDAIHRSFSYAGEQLGFTPPSYETVVKTVGGSVPVTASKLYPDADPEEVSNLFEQRFDQVMYDAVEILPGVEWILSELAKTSKKCVVFTNKRGDRARDVCKHLKLDNLLEGIVGTGDVPYRKPQKEFTEYVLKKFQSTPSECCLIGDSPFDEQAAQVVGMDCYLVATGSHTLSDLASHTNCPVYANLHDLGKGVFDLMP